MVFVGAPGVGISSFINKIIKPKQAENIEMKIKSWEIKTDILSKKYKITIWESNISKIDENYLANEKNLIKGREIVVIFMDISNNQSFSEVAQWWIKFVKDV